MKNDMPILSVILYIAAFLTALAATFLAIHALPVLFFDLIPELRHLRDLGHISWLEIVSESMFFVLDYFFKFYIYALVLAGVGVCVRSGNNK